MTVALENERRASVAKKTLPLKKRAHKLKLAKPRVRISHRVSQNGGTPETLLPLPPATKQHCLEKSETTEQYFQPVSPQSKKRVHFAVTSSFRTRHATDEDLANSWYDADHYRAFEHDKQTSIALYDAGEDVDIEGLEHIAGGREQVVQRRMHTLKHSAVVLELYDVQRCCGVFDDDLMRRVSQRLSEEPVKVAYLRANHRS